MTNMEISRELQKLARNLEQVGANLFRVRAFRTAANAIQRLEISLVELFEVQGKPGLLRLPGIDSSVASTLEGLLLRQELATLRPLDTARSPASDLLTLPGVGYTLAEKLRDTLHVTSLEELTQAAVDGRLNSVGVQGKRLAGILAAARQRLQSQTRPPRHPGPAVAVILRLDREFREGICRGQQHLRVTIAGWAIHVTRAYSALAHRLNRSEDWVMIRFDNGTVSGEWTVATEEEGDLAGKRVIRGRVEECRACYAAQEGARSESAA